MPRLFTGLEIPTNLANDLAMLQSGLPGARWVDPGDFHITLAFLGDVSRDTANEAHHLLSRLDKPELDLRIVGLDTWGSKRTTSVFARVASDRALSELQAAHVSILRRLGVPQEKRRFQPHVTVARTGRCEAKDLARFMGRAAGYMSEAFTATRFLLYSARDSVGGGPYVAEQSYALRERQAA